MTLRKLILSFYSTLILLVSACSSHRPISWLVYYGDQLTNDQIQNMDLLVVEPDHINPKKFEHFDGLWVAYLSLGEVNASRTYFSKLKSKGALLEENKDWPGAFRVNLKSREWHDLLLNEIIPELVQKGYTGLFFDTIDVASYLESKNPQLYGGSVSALVTLIQEIHQKYPNLLLFPNNGLDFINKLAPHVDGVFVEDVYTHYNFSTKNVEKVDPSIRKEKEKSLDLFKNRYQKNVFVIHYGNKPQDELSLWALSQASAKHYHSYLTTVDLNTIGFVPEK